METIFKVLLLLLACVCAVGEDDGDGMFNNKRKLVAFLTTVLIAAVPALCANEEVTACKIPRIAYPHRKRIRKSVDQIMDELGLTHTRRACRMTAASFYILFRSLEPFLEGPPHPRNGPKGGKNGAVSGELRLSAAIRHFAGGSSDDICLVHGTSHSEVFNSVWKIVDAVNLCEELAFKCPVSASVTVISMSASN